MTTDRLAADRERAELLATQAYPGGVSGEMRRGFITGYLTARREDDEPQGDDVVLKCYYPSGTSDIVWSAPSKNVARWRIGNNSNLVGWPDVLAKGYVRRVPLVEQS